jgi:hypothetical protein
MSRNKRLQERNKKVRILFAKISKKNPNWRSDVIINEVAETFFLSTRTIEAILKGEGIYAD